MKNLEKNYYRDNLLNIVNKTNGKPIMVTGRLMYNKNHLKWCTFSEIKPYCEGGDTDILCNHLNLKLADVEKWAVISPHYHNKIFYIVGYPARYRSVGGIRGCLKLYCLKGLPAVFVEDDFVKYKDRLTPHLYEFPVREVVQENSCDDKNL